MSDRAETLRRAAEVAPTVLPPALADSINRDAEYYLPLIEQGKTKGIGPVMARASEVLALAEQQQTPAATPHTWHVGDDPGADRALMVDAAEYVINGRHAAVSAVQRNIRVGFAKAARLVDLLETWGIVGPAEGSMVRDVLVPREQLHDVVEAIRGGRR